MTDAELGKHCMCGCMYLEPECPNCNKITDADRIEALTKERDQWIAHAKNAIWADSEELKEAEAYAEELEKELNTCRMAQAVMDNTVADLEAKLSKAVEALRFYAWENEMRLPSEGPWGAGSTDFGKVARATLEEIKGESQDGMV